jgi:hypothetical protein
MIILEGPVWSFTTMSTNNSQPDDPTIIGPAKGKPEHTYQYNITGTDPDSDMVLACIQWGDNTITDWTAFHNWGDLTFPIHGLQRNHTA